LGLTIRTAGFTPTRKACATDTVGQIGIVHFLALGKTHATSIAVAL